jgi:DUF2934 family protein
MAKSGKRRNMAVATTTDGPSTSRPGPVTDSDITRRAYDLYVARGREHGHDVDDWLRAERELTKASRSAVL